MIVSLMELDEDVPDLEEKNYDITFYEAAAQKPFKKKLLEYGLEAGVNLCIENDNNVLSAGAGPLLIYGSWGHEPDENDDDLDDETESQLSVGAGIRAITTGLEFNDSAGDVKVEGPQVFFNLSFRI